MYKFQSYRAAFEALFEYRRKSKVGWSTALLAQTIGVQPSHITNVVKERNHFSSDQIYSIGLDLKLEIEEIAYLDLLMEWERAEHPLRKTQLKSKILDLRNKKLRLKEELKIQQMDLSSEALELYYLDPNYELLHLFLGTKKAPFEPKEIASIWNLSVDYVEDIIQFLLKNELVEKKRNYWIVKPIHQLLPANSPLCKPQQMLKRLRLFESLQKIQSERAYTFSATLTMSEDTKLQIQSYFLDFLKKVEYLVVKSEPEDIYHFQFELIPWIAGKN